MGWSGGHSSACRLPGGGRAIVLDTYCMSAVCFVCVPGASGAPRAADKEVMSARPGKGSVHWPVSGSTQKSQAQTCVRVG